MPVLLVIIANKQGQGVVASKMAFGGLVYAVFFMLEDFLAWKVGFLGLPFWIVMVIGAILVYFFHAQIMAGIKKLLSLVGIR
jgi:hypothetical protein